VFFFSLKGIDTPTFEAFIPSAVCTTFDTVGRKESITWPEVELALHLLYLYGESIKGPPVFFVGGGGPTFLGQMIISMIKSGVVSYPHTSIAPLYFENVCRYTTFFEAGATEYIPAVMEAFARGLHGDNSRVRNRVYYLFLRFVKGLREFILPIRETVLASVGDLLAIEAPSIKPSRTGVSHESQLYLFEAIGMLISYENTIVEPRTLEYLKALVNPMILQIKEIMEKQLYRLDGVDEEGEPPIVRMHLNHLIMAIGSISKGFPEFKVGGVEAPWCIVFREVLGCVLRVLQVLSTSLLIRDAARFTFQRMVNCMGPLILPLLGSLMTTGLLAASCTRELVDILPFFGLIVHKYDASVIGPLFDGLMAPLLSRIFFLLNMATGGDDERREQEELRRGYLTFLAGMLGRGVDGVFVSEVNKGNFENVLGSVVHCAGSGENPVSQKLALSVLWKMCVAWGGGVEPPNTRKLPGSKAPVPTNPPRAILPGFDGWIESTLVPLLWTVGKGLDMKDAGGLGVLGEIGEVHRCLWGGWGERWIGIVGEGMRGGLGSKEAVVKVLRGAYLK
jgi:exportin-T